MQNIDNDFNSQIDEKNSEANQKDVVTDGETGKPETSTDESLEQQDESALDSNEKKESILEKEEFNLALKKRLKRQEQAHRREIDLITARTEQKLAEMQKDFLLKIQQPAGMQQVMPDGSIAQPDENKQAEDAFERFIDDKVEKKLAERNKRQEAEKYQANIQQQNIELQRRENEMVDKYDDYHDVIDEAKPYLTPVMVSTIREMPAETLENMYLFYKENPAEFKKIKDLSPSQQVFAIARISANIESKKQSRPQSREAATVGDNFVRPTKQSGSSSRKSVYDSSFNDMLDEYYSNTRR